MLFLMRSVRRVPARHALWPSHILRSSTPVHLWVFHTPPHMKRKSPTPPGGSRPSKAAADRPPVIRPAQAAAHEHTRRAHASEIAEDYVEAIADLIDITGEARVVDLAQCLGVSHVTVVRTIARLQRDGLVTARPYRAIFLSQEGRRLAERVKHRHEIVVNFLLALGVDERAARADAEGIEHHVSPETLAVFERFASRSRSAGAAGDRKRPAPGSKGPRRLSAS